MARRSPTGSKRVGSLPYTFSTRRARRSPMSCSIAFHRAGANRPVTLCVEWRPGRVIGVPLISARSDPSACSSAPKATAPPTRPRCSTILAPGSTSLISSSSIRSAPAFHARVSARTTPGPGSTRPAPDIEYLSRIVYDWLVKNSRLNSRKYLVGESYGGFRGPRITHFPQTRLGVAGERRRARLAGIWSRQANDGGDLSPLPWMMTLPSISAANPRTSRQA